MGNEWEGCAVRADQLAALLKFQPRAGLGEMARNIAHCDWALQRWRKTAARDPSHFISFVIEHERTFTDRLSAFNRQPNPTFDWAVFKFGKDQNGARKAAFGPPALVDCKGEAIHPVC